MQVVEYLIASTFHFPFVIISFESKAFEFLSLIKIEQLHISLLLSCQLMGYFFVRQEHWVAFVE